MSKNFTLMFQKSCLAVAVISLSACATTPRQNGVDHGTITGKLEQAGKRTRDAGTRAWQNTKDLFGSTTHSDDELLDEVDLALMEEDAPAPVVNAALMEKQLATSTVADTNIDNVSVAALVHEVQSTETLWDIAKLTTGDANNWHVLADVNNLAPNAAVFPGQQLSIPADLVKPELTVQGTSVEEAFTTSDELAVEGVSPQPETPVVTAVEEQSLDVADLDLTSDSSPTTGDSVELSGEAQPFVVNEGESLWDFAKRTTGDATHWRAIAEHNAFSKKQATLVHAGQTIFVPSDIVKIRSAPDRSSVTAEQKLTGDDNTISSQNAVAQSTEADDESTRMNAFATTSMDAGNDNAAERQQIKIVEATYREDQQEDEVFAVDQLPLRAKGSLNEEKDSQTIMVSGTYYPKAVYNDANFSSSLLMRVSPGTELQVSRAMGAWFEVQTKLGPGYVHSRDIK
jgi:nucleoid-associated protein YgaU